MKIIDIKNSVFKYKKYIFFIFGIYFSALFFLFPYEDLLQKNLIRMGQQNNTVQFEYQSSSIGIFPPRFSLNTVELTAPSFLKSIQLDQITLKPSYLSLLALKLGAKIHLVKENSSVHLWIRKAFSRKQQSFLVQVYSQQLETHHLDFLSSYFAHSKGSLNFLLDFNLDPTLNLPIEGSFQIVGRQLEFKPHSFSRQYIGTIHIPLFKWSSLNGKIDFSDNRVNIETFKVGQPSDSFYLDLNGFINVTFSRLRQSIQEYELDLDLILSEEIKNQFFFIDLFLSDIEEKTQDDQFRYQTRISGRSLYPPKIEKKEDE